MSLREQVFESFDGTRIWCAMEGGGSGVPIVCTNGVGISTFFWDEVRRYFAPDHPVVIWDYRGHGRSERPADLARTTIEDNARDLNGVMEQFGLSTALHVGHSMGSQVVLEFYHLFAEKVVGLAPMLGAFEYPANDFLGIRGFGKMFPWMMNIARQTPALWSSFTRMTLKSPALWPAVRRTLVHHELCDRNAMEPYFKHLAALDFEVFFHMVGHMQQHSARRYIQDILVPVLVVAGEWDRFTRPQHSLEMRHLIPEAEMLYLEHGTHAALLEQPELINLRLEKFIRQRVEPLYMNRRRSI